MRPRSAARRPRSESAAISTARSPTPSPATSARPIFATASRRARKRSAACCWKNFAATTARPIASLPRKFIETLLSTLRPGAEKNWLKALRGLLQYCVAEGLCKEDVTASIKPQAGGSRMHRARDHGHPWPHVAQGSRALHQGFQPREAGALGDGETRQRNGNAEGEELVCQNVRSWGEPDTPGWRE